MQIRLHVVVLEKWPKSNADEVTENQIAEVEKMLGCGDPSLGFATYICLGCGKQPVSGRLKTCEVFKTSQV